MDQQNLDVNIQGIRELLMSLHGEVSALEESYSQMLRALRQVEGIAECDDLSGLLRRKPFFKKWDALVQMCQNLNESCGILLLDIDHFKKINDQHGHPTGDEVIRKVSGLLKQFESPNCFVGRYGGEEFAVGIHGTDAEMLGIAEMIRRGVERLHGEVIGSDGKVQWKCTISVGMASVTKEGYDPQKIIHKADEALYDAKKNGRNQVRPAA